MRLALVVVGGLLVSGCSIAVWPASELASLTLTRKLLIDHAVSGVTGKDCAVTRWENDLSYCREDALRPAGVPACYRTIGDPDCYVHPLPAREAGRQIGVVAPYNVIVRPGVAPSPEHDPTLPAAETSESM